MRLLVFRLGQPTREADRLRVAVGCHAIDLGAAGIREPQHPGDLVERLARCVVDRLAEELHVRHEVAHEQQRRVASRHEQGDGRELDRMPGSARRIQEIGSDVADQMIDRVDRHPQRDGERLGRPHADHQGSGEAGPARDGDGVHVRQPDTRIRERRAERGGECFEVGASGDLGNDAAVPSVLLHRRRDGVRQQCGAAHDPDAGLVAGGLDSEDEGVLPVHAIVVSGGGTVRRITSASMPSGW